MGLESSTFVDDLVTTNPVGAVDDVKQGDDHLRLIKNVLKNTFPNATKAFRFETVLTKTAAYPVVAADARALVLADVSGGAFTVTLPLGSSVFAGFTVIVMKSDSSANAVTVDGNGAETINGTATRSLSVQYQAEKYTWDGTEWKVIAVTKIGTGELVDSSVTSVKLATDAVTTVKILDSNVTLAKIANINTDRILGRETAAAGVIEQLTLTVPMQLASGALKIDIATAANYRAQTANKALDTGVWAAAAEVVLTDAATIVVDMATFLNATVTLAGNRTLGNPTNTKVGQSGIIRVVQDITGSRTLAYGTNWEFEEGTAPVLTTAANAEDLLFYHVISATRIFVSLARNVS